MVDGMTIVAFNASSANVVASDEGFSVKVLGRTGIEYREGGKVAFVDSEVLATGFGMAIFAGSIKGWLAPHENDLMTEEDKRRILENIRRAIVFQKQPVEIL
jgi:hypothetical protein